jgi:hypothetical protein
MMVIVMVMMVVVVVGVMVDPMPGTILNAFHISLNVPNDFRRQVL